MGVASRYSLTYYFWDSVDFILMIINVENLTDSQPL